MNVLPRWSMFVYDRFLPRFIYCLGRKKFPQKNDCKSNWLRSKILHLIWNKILENQNYDNHFFVTTIFAKTTKKWGFFYLLAKRHICCNESLQLNYFLVWNNIKKDFFIDSIIVLSSWHFQALWREKFQDGKALICDAVSW